MKKMRLYGTTDGSGNATVNGEAPVNGCALYAVRWIDGDLADGVDAVISTQGADASATLLTLTNANDDATYYPREATCDNTGTADGDTTLPFMQGTPRLVISSGGDTKSGGCILYYTEL